MHVWYNGGEFAPQDYNEMAKVPGQCPLCHEPFDAGEEIRICNEKPYGPNDWFRAHPDCAVNDSRNVFLKK